jgi:hypothetical protein
VRSVSEATWPTYLNIRLLPTSADRGKTITSIVTPDDFESEPDAQFAAEDQETLSVIASRPLLSGVGIGGRATDSKFRGFARTCIGNRRCRGPRSEPQSAPKSHHKCIYCNFRRHQTLIAYRRPDEPRRKGVISRSSVNLFMCTGGASRPFLHDRHFSAAMPEWLSLERTGMQSGASPPSLNVFATLDQLL